MLRLWKWYQNCLATHPVKTQVISSGFIWGLGDIAAQAVTHSTTKPQKHFESVDVVLMIKGSLFPLLSG
ncbi:Peroxisomal membrane 22 kDa family protein [Perilla frutescens var. frutescens]|nr:Peroxisomal membrane 22 kDa family protein [Perilla frutescens var. frutescens]